VEGRIQACRALLEAARGADGHGSPASRRRDSGLFCDGGEFARAVEGLEPLASEALFFRSKLSAFAAPRLRDLVPPMPGTTIVLIALSLDNACVATVLHGVDIGLRIRIVEDAIGASPLGPYGSGVVTGVVKRLIAPLAQFESALTMRREARVDLRSNPDFIVGGNPTWPAW